MPPDDDTLTSSLDLGVCCESERLVVLKASLKTKKNRTLAWETFAHEYLHALDYEFSGTKVNKGPGRVGPYRGMTHGRVYMLDTPLATLFTENALTFRRCLCA